VRIQLITAWLLVFIQGCTTSDNSDLLIGNVIVISSEGEASATPMDVFIADGRIRSIMNAAANGRASATTTIDGTGKFLMPGLIDSHTHLNEIPGMSFEQERDHPDISAAARRQIPRSYLYHGFTTVIDLNSVPEVVSKWNAVEVRPQAYFCGASPVYGGYPMSFMPEELRAELMPYFLFDETRPDDMPEGIDAGLHTPSAVVDRIHADGGICVKTHYEKGFGGRGNMPVPSVALIAALVEAAHGKELPVLMHANAEAAQAFGVESGVDAFAHGMWTWNDRTLTEINTEVRKVADDALAKKIALQPTIQVLYGEQDMFVPGYLDDPRLKKVLPGSLVDWYKTDEGQWWRQRMLDIPIVAQLVEKGLWQELDAEPVARVSAVLEYYANHDGRLLFGSDTPSDPTFANPPGLNGRFEMDRWIEAGVTPLQLFRAATANNAKFFGLENEIGAMETGMRADLLLLRDNPLENVTAYDTIEYVILGGDVLSRASLAADSP
jgi:imidazolonepropionase-like amidohydrolase